MVFLFFFPRRGHTLYKKEDVSKGKFAFTTDEYDMFEVCFETVKGHGQAREVKLDMKHGVEARNYDDIAKAEKLKPMEVRKWVSYRVCNCWASASL